MSWELLYAIPNLNIDTAFDSEYLSIVPFEDIRLQEIIAANTTAAVLLNGFRTETERRIKPSALIRREDSPQSVTSQSAIVDFRNMFAVACLVRGNARAITSRNILEPVFSDYFDFYPIVLRRSRRGFFIETPATLAIWSSASRVYGSTYAHISVTDLIKGIPDEMLLTRLLKQWHRRYINPAKDTWPTRILFRSLELAYQAFSSPYRSSTIYEYGTHLSLWVSSFETLVQDRHRSRIGYKDVLNLLSAYRWNNRKLDNHRYKTSKERNAPRGGIALKLYCELYYARNAFLHGNPVSKNSLYPFHNSDLPLLPMLIPLIYWMALQVFLPPISARKKLEKVGLAMRECFNKVNYRDALLSIFGN